MRIEQIAPALLLFFLISCSKDKKETPPSLKIDKPALTLSPTAGRDSVIISANTNWSVSYSSSWLSVSPTSGSGNGKIYFSYPINLTSASRSTDVTITGQGITETVLRVSQTPSSPFITVDKTSLLEKAVTHSDTVTVTSNVAWNLSIPAAATSWLSSDKSSDTAGVHNVHFIIATNNTTSPRTASILFSSLTSGVTPVSITVNQEQPDVEISTTTLHARGGEDFTISGIGFSSTPSENLVWINGVAATVTSATSNSLTVIVPPKAGSGPVIVTVNTKSDTTTAFTYDWVGKLVLLAGGTEGYADGTGANAQFLHPAGLAVDAAGNVFVADYANYRVRKITSSGVVTTLPGRVPYDPYNPSSPLIYGLPNDVALDATGNLYVAEVNSNAISRISPAGDVILLAGGNAPSFADGVGTAASFYWPTGITTDPSGNSYVADRINNRIRKVTPAGVVTTIAGSTQGFADGSGTSASFNNPYSLVLDATGNLYVTDYYNERIRKITPGGEVTTFAGNGGSATTDGTGTEAQFDHPLDIAIDTDGNLYVGEESNKIRVITPQGRVTTIGIFEDSLGASIGLNGIFGITVDGNKIIYLSDYNNNRIWKMTSVE